MSLTVSHSQIKAYQECERLWWFDRVCKLPHAGGGEPTFGKVLHAVVERWLRAGIDGRDSKGNAVDLYPQGWQWINDHGRWSRIEPEDEPVLRKLVDLAVAQGHLERLPGRQVERQFGGLLIQADTATGPHVFITGVIDLLVPPAVVLDHKTTNSKDNRYTASEDPESDKYIGDDEQLLTYCKVLADAHPTQAEFTVSHVVYNRKRLTVEKKTATVTRAKVEENWERLKATAEAMAALAGAGHTEEDFRSVRGAIEDSRSDYCSRQYGHPCRFLDVCGGNEDLTKFRRRHLRLALPDENFEEGDSVAHTSIMARLEALKALQGDAPPDMPRTIATPIEPTAQEHAQGYMGPPRYAVRDPVVEPFEAADVCKACSGSGKNSQGGYCVCPLGTRRYAEEKAKPDPTPVAEPAATVADPVTDPVAVDPVVEPFEAVEPVVTPAKKRGRPKKSAPNPTVPSPSASAPAVGPFSTSESAQPAAGDPLLAVDLSSVPEAPKAPVIVEKGHPSLRSHMGPTLLHSAAVLKNTSDYVSITAPELLRKAVEDLGGTKLEDFYKQDVWKRRDLLKSLGKQIAERLDGVFVLSHGTDGDEAALVAAIAPYSSIEIGARA